MSCEVSFDVTFEEVDAELNFCPQCGQVIIEDIELIEDSFDIDHDILYDDEAE
jgi:Zn-finger nucleic acid-binding protein